MSKKLTTLPVRTCKQTHCQRPDIVASYVYILMLANSWLRIDTLQNRIILKRGIDAKKYQNAQNRYFVIVTSNRFLYFKNLNITYSS